MSNEDLVFLEIRGERFLGRRVGVSWNLMKYAKARQAAQVVIPADMPDGPQRAALEAKRSEAGMALMAIMHDTAMILLRPEERGRFSDFMDELSAEGLEESELENAIGSLLATAGGQGEASPKAEPNTSSHSSPVSPTTSATSPAISSAPVTFEEMQLFEDAKI